jgi:hypothetical protein
MLFHSALRSFLQYIAAIQNGVVAVKTFDFIISVRVVNRVIICPYKVECTYFA